MFTANVDYRVVPQKEAVEPSTGKPYRATVVGLGRYVGEASASVNYDVTVGDLSSCTVKVSPPAFNFSVQAPAGREIGRASCRERV